MPFDVGVGQGKMMWLHEPVEALVEEVLLALAGDEAERVEPDHGGDAVGAEPGRVHHEPGPHPSVGHRQLEAIVDDGDLRDRRIEQQGRRRCSTASSASAKQAS